MSILFLKLFYFILFNNLKFYFELIDLAKALMVALVADELSGPFIVLVVSIDARSHFVDLAFSECLVQVFFVGVEFDYLYSIDLVKVKVLEFSHCMYYLSLSFCLYYSIH